MARDLCPSPGGQQCEGQPITEVSTLHGGTFMATQAAHLPPLLGGHKAPYWGLAFCWLADYQLSCQFIRPIKDIGKQGSRLETEVGLLSPLWPPPGLISCCSGSWQPPEGD